ncbi:hypothetical protein GGR57DRAFT_274022 [Xylariaceae sp. FL1272]|nr:hypothetical protein GGR57DRAFT_274022 [Xylariaceae sp. FL1272]
MALSDSSEYVGWRLIVFVSVFTPLQIALVALRFYARSLTKARYDIGDILVVIALLAGLVQTGISIGAEIQAGVGVHLLYLEETDPEKITLFFKYLVAISVWYFATITITKLAICRLYRTLFPQKTVFYILIVTATILVLTPIATTITLLAACQPFSANWGSAEVQATHCINKEAVFVWGTIPNIITDIVLLVIPLPIVWKLHTTTKLKIALSITFIIGSVGLLASILRFISFYNTNSFSDATFNADELIIWTIAEPGIYLISACLLVLRPLLEKFKTGISTKLGTYAGTTAKSRATSDSHDLDTFEGNNRMNIALVSTGGHGGFIQLSDTEDDTKTRSSEQHIKVTTDIEQNYYAK